MNSGNKKYINLIVWVISLVLIGALIGSIARNSVNAWYQTLSRSPLTPPSYLFGIVWSVLYAMIAISGWLIWSAKPSSGTKLIRGLYLAQLILNWSWTPLFFYYHSPFVALICLSMTLALVGALVFETRKKLPYVSMLMFPYLLWLLFAGHLNFYIWRYN